MKWTTEAPKELGFYWATFYGYEYPEVVYLANTGLWACGADKPLSGKEIQYWSDSKIELPQES